MAGWPLLKERAPGWELLVRAQARFRLEGLRSQEAGLREARLA